MRDPARVKDEILSAVLESSSRHLEQAAENIGEIKCILSWAKNPRERTTINIILDDQKKVVKALGRLVDDLSEVCNSRPM